jgi:hypothetical protein
VARPSAARQLAVEVEEVEHLAIEDDPVRLAGGAIDLPVTGDAVGHRLVAGRTEIEDRQPGVQQHRRGVAAQRVRRGHHLRAGVIGPAVAHGREHARGRACG